MHTLAPIFLRNQPRMARMQVGFIDRPVRMRCYCLRIRLNRAPEVREVAIQIIDRLDLRLMRPPEQHRETPRERLDVVGHVAERAPHDVGDAAFTAETTGTVLVERSRSASFLRGNALLIAFAISPHHPLHRHQRRLRRREGHRTMSSP